MRVVGTGEPVVLLLHGVVAAGNSFGAAYDALGEHATVVVPDLLGFGGSMDATHETDSSANIAALDGALTVVRRPGGGGRARSAHGADGVGYGR